MTGIRLAPKACCEGHTAPLDAVWAAYAADDPVVVWKASRGLGGKTTAMAALVVIEAETLGASVSLLGGSGEQSRRVNEAQGEFRKAPGYPELASEPTTYTTDYKSGGHVQALMASSRSVRGGHPQRLRLDEVDEIALPILDAALGQPMSRDGVRDQTLLSSTHQYPDGTMTEVLRRAAERGYPIFEWCYRENQLANGGWVTPDHEERARARVPALMWLVEYELQEPSPEGRAIDIEKVAAMFDPRLGEMDARPGIKLVLEEPDPIGKYATGADWAKEQDWTVIATLRTDVQPARLVCYQRTQRRPWPAMIAAYDEQVNAYKGIQFGACHDGTGLGDVIDDLITVTAEGVQMVGNARKNLLSNYVKAVEDGEIIAPRIIQPFNAHKYATHDDLYGSGHLPDDIAAMALAWRAKGKIIQGWHSGTMIADMRI